MNAVTLLTLLLAVTVPATGTILDKLTQENLPCPDNNGFRVRRPFRDLTSEEAALYFAAQQALPDLDAWNSVHKASSTSNYAHGSNNFLPWHRIFTYEYETALRNLDPSYKCVTVPYWDVQADSTDAFASPLFAATDSNAYIAEYGQKLNFGSAVKGCIQDSFNDDATFKGKCVKRKFKNDLSIAGPAMFLQYAYDAATAGSIADFTEHQESEHGKVHVWVGGSMGKADAVRDPLFFLLHANVDMLWAFYQDCADLEKIHLADPSQISAAIYLAEKSGEGLDDPMPGFDSLTQDITPRDALFLTDLKVKYATSDIFVLMTSQVNAACTATSGASGSFTNDWSTFILPSDVSLLQTSTGVKGSVTVHSTEEHLAHLMAGEEQAFKEVLQETHDTASALLASVKEECDHATTTSDAALQQAAAEWSAIFDVTITNVCNHLDTFQGTIYYHDTDTDSATN